MRVFILPPLLTHHDELGPFCGPLPCRLSCLASCLGLLKHCVLVYNALPSFHAIVGPHRALAEHLVDCGLPQDLQVSLLPPA